MSQIKLIFDGESFPVDRAAAQQACDVLALDGHIDHWIVRSRVTADVFRLFVSAVGGEPIELTNENVEGLSTLCDEFEFGNLSRRVERFKNTSIYRLEKRFAKMEEGIEVVLGRVALLEAEMTALRSTGETVTTPTLTRLGAEVRTFKDSTGPLQSDVALLQGRMNDFPALFEAQLGRLARLEAEVSALRTVSFGEIRSEVDNLRMAFSAVEEEALHLSEVENRIREMEEHRQDGRRKVASLRHKLPQVQEALEAKIRTEAESASRRANEIEQHVGEVRREVDNVCMALGEVKQLAEPLGWNSAIVPDFPKLFEDFKKKEFTLLWRGSRDGFGARDFHSRCDAHPNTLTVILNTDGNIFGGFTPLEWESKTRYKGDPSLKSFIFTLKNPHKVPPRRFALKAAKKDSAIFCDSDCGPSFFDVHVLDDCNTRASSSALFGDSYINNTGLDGQTFFTGSMQFQVKEIEIFDITN
jgi:predicted  nucleic acid-binding Zn-ribbon protein